MTQRRRVSRSLCLALLAVLTVVSLSYFPLFRTRAASVTATVLASAGKPLVNLKNPQSLKVTYTGASEAVGALQSGSAIATALASADFDADGAIDVVAGYSTGNGGVIALYRGNKDAFSPTNPALYPKAVKGSIASTFLPKAQAFSVPESADMLATGDFNRDGYQDVLVGTKGSNIYMLAGDGAGNLMPAQIVPLTGQVRAFAVLADAHVAVSLDNPNGSELAILSSGIEGLAVSATYPLPAPGDLIAWGNLGGGVDLAVSAGNNIAFIYNALSAKPQTETITIPFQVKGLTLGDFIWDQDGRTEISVLADDGSVQILQHGVLNTAPLTAAQIPARRKAYSPKTARQPSNPTALGTWTVAKQLPYTGSAPATTLSASAFSSPHVAQSSTHDVMVLDAGSNQLNILDTSGKTASPSAAISFTGTPVAALVTPQKIDAARDIVVLTSAQSAPMSIAVPGTFTFNVNTTADIDSVNACATNSTVTSPPATLSLREAVCIANNNGASTVTINVPSGTYSLSTSTFGGSGSGSSSPELQVGIQSGNNITISGAGAGSTIIQQTVSGSRIIEADQELAGNMPLAIQNLTLQNGNCTDPGLDCLDNGGGAILAGGVTGDTLTVANLNFNHNSVLSGSSTSGGAVFYTGSSLTVTGSTFTQNTADGTGGGDGGAIFATDVVGGSGVSGSVTITNSTFTNNFADSSQNTSGGGLYFQGISGFSGSVTGSTFTGNTSTGTHSGIGGGIFAGTEDTTHPPSFSISNSRIVGNSAASSGGGFYEAFANSTVTNNWWGCNAGPGASGCDTVFFDSGTSTFTPWLVLSVSASPNQINANGTSTLTADLTHNSASTGGFSVPNGPVSFGGTLDSSVNPSSTTLTSGQANSTYTAGSTSGAGTGTATVDNQQVSTSISILVSVTVTTSPANLSITVDGVTSTAPQTFSWVVGSPHTIATTSPQNVSSGTEQVFSSWSDSGAISHSVSAPSSSTTYTANFTEEYQLTTVASPSVDGTVTPPPGSYFASGASIAVTATANSGFAFNNWTSTGGSFDSTTAASTNFHMPAAATTVTGNFVPATTQITITTSPANLLVSVDGGTLTPAPLVETWNQGSSHTIATTSPQSGGTGIQYVFSAWSDSGAISHGITVPTTATTYTASFVTQYQLTTAANPSIGGTVMPTSGNYYTSGTSVPLTATANAGYTFVNWTGNVANSTSASTSITMTAPQSVTANFSLIIVASPTTTSVSSNNNPSFTSAPGNSVTFTATVTSNTTVNEGTVTFSDPANNFTCSGGNTVAVSNGQASCTTSFTTEGANTITAAYNGTVNFQTSNGNITQTVNNHTVQNGNQFCNQGAITIPSTAGAATPYPSNIFVAGLNGNVGAVTVSLNNISSSDIQQSDLLLVGPTGAQIVPFASVGDSSTVANVSIVLDDTAATQLSGSLLTSGTYKPTSKTGSETLVFPAPAPVVSNSSYAAPDGVSTLTTTFQNTAPNGTWALYAMDNAGNGAASIGGGWCVNISPVASQVTITTSPAGLLVSADGGAPTAAPLVENWAPGSSHTIATSSPQAGAAGVQYVFNSWSDSGAISHSITVPSTATTYTASFDTQYQLTTQASPPADGTVTPASGSYFASGATIPVTATANSGFSFSNWTSTGGTFDSNTAASTNFHMPAAPATVTGNFGNASVQITITTSPANLLVSVDGGATTSAPLVENWVIGSSHTIATTSPQSGATGVQYVFSSWSDSGAISHSITVPSTATTYTASFNTQYQLTTQASPPADGTVTPTSGGYYASGASIPVTATANSGFSFSNWTSTGGTFDSNTAASTNFHMPAAPATVTGNFGNASVQITVTTNPANLLVSVDGGTATAAPLVETWVIGSSHTIATTSPQSGAAGVQHVFSSWSDSGAISHGITVPSTATTYTASFNTQYQLTTQASPPADGSVTPASGGYYASGASIPVTATANSGFQFSNWTSTGGTFDSTTSASTNFHMPATPATVTGNFATSAVQITVTTSPAHLLVSVDGGTATAAPLVESWIPGSSHTIATTSPQSGGTGVQYLFSSWSDSGAISHSITVPSSATTYTASFATQYQLTTAANPTNGGTVSPASGSFYNSGAVVPIMATPNAGFTFTNWTGNVANANSASTTVTMSSPQSVTANFSSSPQITITPSSINFGTVYFLNLKAANVTVKNTGTGTLNISKVGLTFGSGTNKDDFAFISLCPSTLAAGKSCIIQVFFFAGNIGNLSATLNITDNASGSPQQVPLSATVINPIPFFRPGNLNFGTVKVGHSSTQNVTLINVGTTPLNIGSVTTTGTNANNFVPVNGCPTSLAPGNSCIIAVKFTPSATGSRSANLTVVDNAEIGKQNIPLTGKGN